MFLSAISFNFCNFISAAAIIIGFGVALYFIISDAIDKKTEDCLTKHFFTEKIFQTLNLTSEKDPSKITYTREDCQWIVDEARNRTVSRIKEMHNVSECVKKAYEGRLLNFILFKLALDKQNRQEDGSKVLMGVHQMAMKACNESLPISEM